MLIDDMDKIYDILSNPPKRHSIPSRGGGMGVNPPDWREAARLIADIVARTLNKKPIKFRK